MSHSYNLRSHPHKRLIDHLQNVGSLSKKTINSKRIKCKNIFADVAYLIGISHDFGKATTFFQRRLDGDKERTEKARHGFLSSLFGYYLVRKYSNKIKYSWYFPIIAWLVIKRHHGNIQNLKWDGLDAEIHSLSETNRRLIQKQIEDIVQNNLDEINRIYRKLIEDFEIKEFIECVENWEDLTRQIRKEVKNLCGKMKIKHFFNILFFYSILLDADKMDASGIDKSPRIEDISKIVVDNFKLKKFAGSEGNINKLREEAYKEVNNSIQTLNLTSDRILAINLPTGLGKTLTGLSFSLGLRERVIKEFGFTPRIIYCLPFLSIIDQNSKVVEEVLTIGGNYINIPSNLLLKHHHLVDVAYKTETDGELNPIESLNKSLLLMEGWNSEIVITTFVQLFHSLITNRNRAARKFHNIMNSIIILDEIQSIPHKYWLLIKETLTELANEFNCWIVLMTATQPLIFEGETKHLIRNRIRYYTAFDRLDFIFDIDEGGKLASMDFNSFKSRVFEEILKRKVDFMIVLNTISSCKELYEFLKHKLREHLNCNPKMDEDGICCYPNLNLINLSTSILPSFRLRRIMRIKEEESRKIVISTQLIEAGVDISADIIYRDLAPLDCIIQTAGRCNRNNKGIRGEVHTVLLKDERGRPFHSYVYDKILTDLTKRIIEGFRVEVSERAFILKAISKYYKLLKDRITSSVSRALLDDIRKLNFSRVAEFRLIENAPSITTFIEIDEEAKKVREELTEIFMLRKRFERKERILRLRSEINKNTISIRHTGRTESVESLPILENKFFRYVPNEELGEWYKMDTGFYIHDLKAKII